MPCKGRICSIEGRTCFDKTGERKNYQCGDIRMAGKITRSVLFQSCSHFILGNIIESTGLSSPWGCPPIVKAFLEVICEDGFPVHHNFGNVTEIENTTYSNNGGNYWIDAPFSDIKSEVLHRCDGVRGGIKGFAVEFEMEVESRWNRLLGKNQHYLVGKDGVSLGGMTDGLFLFAGFIDKKHLFTEEDILKGAHMNVDVSDIESSYGNSPKNITYWEPQYQKLNLYEQTQLILERIRHR